MSRDDTMNFGGPPTIEKLDIVKEYLNAYTTALKYKPRKDNPFKLMYIDAFAGTGEYKSRQEDPSGAQVVIDGSSRRAINIKNKPFDRLIFIEKDPEKYGKLLRLKRENVHRDIQVENCDANSFLRNMREDWRKWRGVLFLDPFGTEVEWKTIEKISKFEALDTWMLFPMSGIARMLPRAGLPSEEWTKKLNLIFGDESWKELYYRRQQHLFDDEQHERDRGYRGIRRIYKNKLKNLFEQRFMEESYVYPTGKFRFEFIFCVGNPAGIRLAKKISRDILQKRAKP